MRGSFASRLFLSLDDGALNNNGESAEREREEQEVFSFEAQASDDRRDSKREGKREPESCRQGDSFRLYNNIIRYQKSQIQETQRM